jgi:hypothetical protein
METIGKKEGKKKRVNEAKKKCKNRLKINE